MYALDVDIDIFLFLFSSEVNVLLDLIYYQRIKVLSDQHASHAHPVSHW